MNSIRLHALLVLFAFVLTSVPSEIFSCSEHRSNSLSSNEISQSQPDYSDRIDEEHDKAKIISESLPYKHAKKKAPLDFFSFFDYLTDSESESSEDDPEESEEPLRFLGRREASLYLNKLFDPFSIRPNQYIASFLMRVWRPPRICS